MRIVIIGEFSSFSKNLSAGFRSLGHECFVFSWGDGFKKIALDGEGYYVKMPCLDNIPTFLRGILYRYKCYCSYIDLKKKVKSISSRKKWDAVLIVSPNFIKKQGLSNIHFPYFSKDMILSMVNFPENIFLSACGGDVPFYDYWKDQNFKNKHIVDVNIKRYLSPDSIRHFDYYSSFINKVIPISWTYAEAWRKSRMVKKYTICPTIPLPVDTKKYQPFNKIGDKIVIFHGIIRPETKGSSYIMSAMKKLQEDFPDKVECIAKGGMPLDEYLEVLNKTNILIDQTYACSSGMNALYSLAMGKALLGGNVPENSIENNYPNIPIIDIGPDTEQIYKKLEELVNNPQGILHMSKEGRKYVEQVHDSKVVAARYIETFCKYGLNLS